jgi:dipeptidyl aminopeptidase/acylaminoacyl peptidase
MPVAGGDPVVLLPELPHEINGATWSADGKSIYFLANTGVRQELFQVDVASRKVSQLTQGDHTVGSWSYEPSLGRHAFTISTPTSAGDVWTLNASRRSRPTRVTGVFDYLAREFRLPRTEAVQWKGEDGATVEGLVFYPLDYQEGQRYPLVVQTHGGPAASDKFSWHSSSNYVPVLTAMGYLVLKPNYRGSTGYGDAFLRDMVGNYFNQAHKDVMAGVDHLIGQGMADGDRMAKMG